MENLLKIGYFRKVKSTGETSYIAFKEFYSWSEEGRANLYRQAEMKQCKLFCACNIENTLELTVTSNYVVRVKSNKQQSEHMDSCPKSTVYAHWNDSSENGVRASEDEQVFFNIALPSVVKSKSTSSSSGSSTSSVPDPANKRTGILDMVITLNKKAWELQTFSIRKKIREANKAGEAQTWNYKDIDSFNRLIFGMSNQIYARCQGEIIPFSSLCYRKDAFYACDDWRRQWFVYALIEKIGQVKKERKYQYVTVRMPSNVSANKAVIRIETEMFEKMFADYEEQLQGTHRVLAGYICRKSFNNGDGSVSEWMHFLKGIVLRVSENGLYCESETVSKITNYLCKNHVVFTRPYFPLENYGSEVPTFLVGRYNKKDLILDVPATEKILVKREGYTEDNSEYDVVLLDETNYEEKVEFLCKDKR